MIFFFRRVIAEILKDINDYKKEENLPKERKKNPLGKPNKRFLGRTINPVMKHNKRQSDYNHRRCQRKLRELNAKERKWEYQQRYRAYEKDSKRRSKSSSNEVISSATEDEDHNDKKSKNIKKKKRKTKKKKHKSSSSWSSSSSSSSSETESDYSTLTAKKRHKEHEKDKTETSFQSEEKEDEFYTDMTHDQGLGYYMDPHVAYAAMAYSHINQVLQNQMVQEQQTIKNELDENVEIPSDLSLSYHSESSLNISLNSSSAEEDENGILTFKLISSDDEKKCDLQNISTKRNEIEDDIVMIIDSDDNDKSSVKSYESLESTASQNPSRKINEIFLLNSSSSGSEDLEIIATISETKQEHLQLAVVDSSEKKTYGVDQINENINKTDEVVIPNENALPNESQVLKKEVPGIGLIVNEEEKTVETLASKSENEIPTIKENKKVFQNNLNTIKDNDGEIDDNSALNTNKVEISANISNATMIDLTEE